MPSIAVLLTFASLMFLGSAVCLAGSGLLIWNLLKAL